MGSTIYDDGFAFRFEPSAEKQSLRSVAIDSYGVPELRFDSSTQTLSLTEEDVAVICQLVSEGKRPNFTYHGIDSSHPFFGRQYMVYDPPWLKGTTVGEVLSEVDWKMKCLNVGAQTDKTGSVFFSRDKVSVTKGLATVLDFADENPNSPGYIFTRCAGVKVQTYDDELVFWNDPKLTIDYYKSRLYSEYITRVLPLIAEHDEQSFLRLQEIIKMVCAAEWLKEKGIEMSKKWMKALTSGKNTAVSVRGKGNAGSGNRQLLSEIKNSISRVRQTVDISMNADERKGSKQLANPGANRYYYGWYDNGSGEMVQFQEDGEWYKECQSLRRYNEVTVTANGRTVGREVWLQNFGIPLPNKMRIEDIWNLGKEITTLKIGHHEGYNIIGPVSVDIQVKNLTEEKGKETSLTAEITQGGYLQPPGQAPSKFQLTALIRESTTDWDYIYQGLNPQKPMMPLPNIVDAPVVPKETSWNELYSETVPWPRVWVSSPDGEGVLSAAGGVRTDVIPKEEVPRDGVRKTKEQYTSSVVARHEGSIRLLGSKEAEEASKLFRDKWIGQEKGPCPIVRGVFAVTNGGLLNKWNVYKQKLTVKIIERHFHGTTLRCDISGRNNGSLCSESDCGICGISNDGFSEKFITNEYQRFGKGFYLAPNSSKANDYSVGNTAKLKAQLLCDVCPGNKCILTKNDTSLLQPPAGYNSVYGMEGDDLNYPEIVIYCKDAAAIMPRFVIVYG